MSENPVNAAIDLSWRTALYGLPLEQPVADAWPAIQRRSQGMGRRRRRAGWLALAAALGAIALLPMRSVVPPALVGLEMMRPAAPAPASATPSDGRTSAGGPQAAVALSTPATSNTRMRPTPVPGPRAAQSPPLPKVVAAAPKVVLAGAPTPQNTSGTAAATTGVSDLVPAVPTADPALADPTALPDTALAFATPDSGAANLPVTTELDRLQRESAQLETLLAFVRDDRVVNGVAAALAADMQAQVAQIDAALGQTLPSSAQASALWRQRLQALRQLTDFESGQRLLSAHGSAYDPVLVAVQ